MLDWEISYIEKMPEEEQKRYYDKLISKYQEKIKELKREQKNNNHQAAGALIWRAGLIASAVALFAGPAMAVLGEGAVQTIGEIASVGSIGLFGASIVGSIAVDDDGPKDIKIGFEAARDAKKQIKEIKEKMKNVEKKQAMGAR